MDSHDPNLVVPLVWGDNLIYVYVRNRRAAVIDPGSAGPVLELLRRRSWTLEWVLNTHHHGDHCAGNNALKRATQCRIAGPPSVPGVDYAVSEGDRIDFVGETLRVLSTPGHTRDHVCFLSSDGCNLWTGDTLFGCGCGRVFADFETIWKSLSKLAGFEDDVRIWFGHEYTAENVRFALQFEPRNPELQSRSNALDDTIGGCGHSAPSTMGLEKKTNPFLRPFSAEIRSILQMEEASDIQVFTALRRRKDRF